MTKTLVVILALTVISDGLAELVNLPAPGAAIGMIFLATIFALRGKVDVETAQLFDLAAPHFPLFFIPAAAGIVASEEMLAQSWLYIAIAIILGTGVTIITTGVLAQYLLSVLRRVRTA